MFRRRIYIIVVAVMIGAMQNDHVEAQNQPELNYAPGELLVRFAPKGTGLQLDMNEKNQILNSLGGAILQHDYKMVPGLSLIKLPANQKVAEVLETYNSVNGILYAEPNYRIEGFMTEPNDLYWGAQWSLHNTGQTGGNIDADIDAVEAWEIRTNVDPNIIVAVLDTGVDYTHLDLTGNMGIIDAEI